MESFCKGWFLTEFQHSNAARPLHKHCKSHFDRLALWFVPSILIDRKADHSSGIPTIAVGFSVQTILFTLSWFPASSFSAVDRSMRQQNHTQLASGSDWH